MSSLITQEIVREFLDYDPETGILTWKNRDRKWFPSDGIYKSWNTRVAGKEAFTRLHTKGYLQGAIFHKTYKAHRIIWLYMKGEWPDQIDHINHNKEDNRWYNLREVSNQENSKNQSQYITNTSGCTGVYWHKQGRKWVAQIKVDDYVYLGRFDLLEDAISARKVAEIKYGFHKNHGSEKGEV